MQISARVLALSSVICLILIPGSDSDAQTHKRPNSKHATQVDSISAPPRMDGKTGRYDTVRHPRRNGQSSKKRGTDYQYNRHTDTISAKPKTRP